MCGFWVLTVLRGTKTSPCMAELIPPWTGGRARTAKSMESNSQEMSGAGLCVLPSELELILWLSSQFPVPRCCRATPGWTDGQRDRQTSGGSSTSCSLCCLPRLCEPPAPPLASNPQLIPGFNHGIYTIHGFNLDLEGSESQLPAPHRDNL